ncbi:MAG: hypothetical protein WKF57_06045 [Nakamurella sp.]
MAFTPALRRIDDAAATRLAQQAIADPQREPAVRADLCWMVVLSPLVRHWARQYFPSAGHLVEDCEIEIQRILEAKIRRSSGGLDLAQIAGGTKLSVVVNALCRNQVFASTVIRNVKTRLRLVGDPVGASQEVDLAAVGSDEVVVSPVAATPSVRTDPDQAEYHDRLEALILSLESSRKSVGGIHQSARYLRANLQIRQLAPLDDEHREAVAAEIDEDRAAASTAVQNAYAGIPAEDTDQPVLTGILRASYDEDELAKLSEVADDNILPLWLIVKSMVTPRPMLAKTTCARLHEAARHLSDEAQWSPLSALVVDCFLDSISDLPRELSPYFKAAVPRTDEERAAATQRLHHAAAAAAKHRFAPMGSSVEAVVLWLDDQLGAVEMIEAQELKQRTDVRALVDNFAARSEVRGIAG